MIDLVFLSTAYLDFRVFKIAKSANTCLHIDSSKVGFFFLQKQRFYFHIRKDSILLRKFVFKCYFLKFLQ